MSEKKPSGPSAWMSKRKNRLILAVTLSVLVTLGGLTGLYLRAGGTRGTFALLGALTRDALRGEQGGPAEMDPTNNLIPVNGQDGGDPAPTPVPTAMPTPLPTIAPSPTPEPIRRARVKIAGDIMVHDNELIAAKSETGAYDFHPFFERIAPVLKDADLTIGNFETTCSGEDIGYKGYPRFNSPDSLLDAVKDAGFSVLTFSNNHCLDYKMEGLRATLTKARAAGLAITGSYESPEASAATPMIRTVNGIKIAILAYTSSTNGMEAACKQEDVDYAIRYIRTETVKTDIQKARAAGAEYVIVCPHWGEEYTRKPSPEMKRLAQVFLESGADAVIGSHPHMAHPVEMVPVQREDGTQVQGLVAYSLGNFISDQRAQYKDTGLIVAFDIVAEDGVVRTENPTAIPTWVFRVKNDEGIDYRILPLGEYHGREEKLPGMRGSDQSRMKAAWSEITALLGDAVQVE